MPRSDKNDERWMKRAMDLARRGTALASPNPLVGAVLVKNGRAVAEGFHTYDGVKHAEVLALEKAGKKARGATLYINLEPCCHTGRTGPCTDALIQAGVGRVVAAMKDPNPAVSGRGLARLRRAGILVDVGLCQNEARRLNEAFAKWIRIGLPFVTLKTAMTLDAKIAGPPSRRKGGSVTWITSPESRAEVHRMRHASDALLTGIGTVLADNPRLTDRTGRRRRRPLLRAVLDSRLRLPPRSKLVRSSRGDVIVFTAASPDSRKGRALRLSGVEVVRVAKHRRKLDLRAVLKELGRRGILSVLIEPGAELFGAALKARVVDKLVLFLAPHTIEGGIRVKAPPLTRKDGRATHEMRLRHCGPDLVVEGYLRDVYRDH
jgi:diaminohydroxyphosphoribosylaminopyrimidine deaminase/5-amino-6-(5-phosphoribosylamino)uracil reductase